MAPYRVEVRVMPRAALLDPQGRQWSTPCMRWGSRR